MPYETKTSLFYVTSFAFTCILVSGGMIAIDYWKYPATTPSPDAMQQVREVAVGIGLLGALILLLACVNTARKHSNVNELVGLIFLSVVNVLSISWVIYYITNIKNVDGASSTHIMDKLYLASLITFGAISFLMSIMVCSLGDCSASAEPVLLSPVPLPRLG